MKAGGVFTFPQNIKRAYIPIEIKLMMYPWLNYIILGFMGFKEENGGNQVHFTRWYMHIFEDIFSRTLSTFCLFYISKEIRGVLGEYQEGSSWELMISPEMSKYKIYFCMRVVLQLVLLVKTMLRALD